MPNAIENRFIEICERSDGGKILRAQWEYDKRHLTSALSTISANFPHYSQHDASHSETILNRITSVLGLARLSLLSVTDLWLILESAYNHDAGMVATAIQKSGDLNSAEFSKFLSDSEAGRDKELAESCRRLANVGPLNSPLEIYEISQVLILTYSEYLRRKHAFRAAGAVLDPLTALAMPSPRTTLIPSRLMEMVANICVAHGKDFTFTMSLPFRELGLEIDYCHPRFAACMLRIGDLLDLDSGRFCPCVNSQISEMPSLSRAHFRKHEGIKHFLVSDDVIEVTAEYDDIEAYMEAHRWFEWIRQELTAHTLNWRDIRPGIEFGGYPSIGKISATLKYQIVFESNTRPRLELDRQKLLDLMRGANIYSGPFDSIREVIQNSIDATLLRLSLDLQSAGKKHPQNLPDLRAQLDQYPIEIRFTRLADSEKSGIQPWKLQVLDNGIGMTRIDIQRLLSVGSRVRSAGQAVLFDWLAEWARPSGAFGIGFKSLFQFCKEVQVESRHPYESETLRVNFSRKLLSDDPTVIVTSKVHCDNEIRPRPGTRVEAIFELEKLPSSLNLFGSSTVNDALRKFDQLVDDELPHLNLRIEDDLHVLALSSICSLVINGDDPARTMTCADQSRLFFCRDSGIELKFRGTTLADGFVDTLYRGAKVEGRVFVPIVSFQANVLAGSSIDLLNLSRNKWTAQGERFVSSKINDVLPIAVSEWLNKPDTPNEDVPLLSLFMAVHKDDYSNDSRWKDVKLNDDITLSEIRDADRVVLEVADSSAVSQKPIRCSRDSSSIELSWVDLNKIGGSWLAKFLRSAFNKVEIGVPNEKRSTRYIFSKGSAAANEVDPEALVLLLLDAAPVVGQRFYVHCPDRYSMLSTSNAGRFVWWRDDFFTKRMISPFVRPSRSEGLQIGNLEGYVHYLSSREDRKRPAVCAALRNLADELWKNQIWSDKAGFKKANFIAAIDDVERQSA